MHTSGYLQNTSTQPSSFVQMKNCATLIIVLMFSRIEYLGIVNCLCKFDYNVPVFLLILFILLFTQNSQNPSEQNLYAYVFVLALLSALFDILWLLLVFSSYSQVYSENDIKSSLKDTQIFMNSWNYLHGIHVTNLIISTVILMIKVPFIYQSYQRRALKEN